MKFRILIFVFVGLISTKLLLVSCTKDKAPAPIVVNQIVLTLECPDTIFYSTQIKPYIDNSCATMGCHDAMTHAFGYDLSTYENISLNAKAILNSIKPGAIPSPMPFGGTAVNDSIISHINCWINQGKLNN